MRLMLEEGDLLEAELINMGERDQSDDDPSVKEQEVYYCV